MTKRGASKKMRKLMEEAERQGWRVRDENSAHPQYLSPDGETIVTVSPNGEGRRAYSNMVAEFRRAGLRLPR